MTLQNITDFIAQIDANNMTFSVLPSRSNLWIHITLLKASEQYRVKMEEKKLDKEI